MDKHKHSAESRAIVIGAGIAGLLAARVLSDYFEHVTILERDRLGTSAIRPGVPQSRHAHVLLVRGLLILDALFPGFKNELIAAGAVQGDGCLETVIMLRGKIWPRFPSELRGLSMSRTMLENRLRGRIAKLSNVTIREDCGVSSLVGNDGGSICGVTIQSKHSDTSVELGDIVVDASGNRSQSTNWLKEHGIKLPEECRVNAFVGYATRRFRYPSSWKRDWKIALAFWWPPKNRRGGVILPEEDGNFVISLIGAGSDMPPIDEAGFHEHAQFLEQDVLAKAIHESEPVSSITGYRPSGNRLRSYTGSSRKICGLVVMGDALCMVNPVYGQGMTSAALQAEVLQNYLKRCSRAQITSISQYTSNMQKKLERVVSLPWLLATSEDFRHGDIVEGRQTLMNRLVGWFTEKVLHNNSMAVVHAFAKTINLTEPFALLHPFVLIQVLLTSTKAARRDTAPHDCVAKNRES